MNFRLGLGLLAKLNLLAVTLIIGTAISVGVVLVRDQSGKERTKLESQGTAIAGLAAEAAEQALVTGNRGAVLRVFDSLSGDADVAYIAVLDARGVPLVERGFRGSALPETPPVLREGALDTPAQVTTTLGDKSYLEFLAPVVPAASPRPAPPAGAPSAEAPGRPAATAPIAYVRVGMSLTRLDERVRELATSAAGVVAALSIASIVLTLAVTRQIVSPIGNLIRAAEAVTKGDLDARVPVTSGDELGVLAHTFNTMTTQLSASRKAVSEYQRTLQENRRTLEDKVEQRTRELQVATARAFQLAQQDILTGLPNRVLLWQRLQQMVASSARDQRKLAVLFLDFDHFKRINDTLGHDMGDLLLKEVAKRLTEAVRDSDLVARLGGDEFVIVLPGLDPSGPVRDLISLLVDRVRSAFDKPVTLADQDLMLTISIGVSLFPDDAADAAGLIKQADTAMYAAKERGRDGFCFYTSDMNARVQARLELERSMRRGLSEQEFYLVYQPQIDLASGTPVGVEALVRWRDPLRGLIAPAEFIPVAEESGLINPLGAWVLTTACRQVNAWHEQNMPMRLSVNLSVRQLEQDDLLRMVERVLADSGLEPAFLDIEVTESIIISNPDRAIATLTRLRQMGVSVTMDDFGTGYSSLSYLTRLPLHGVKVDQRFVRGLEREHNSQAITQAIITLAHSLGMRVVAEGVETAEQYTVLQQYRCEEAQGFYISHPLPSDALQSWWRERQEFSRIMKTGAAADRLGVV